MTLKEKVEDALKEVRPMLEADGGSIELVDVTDDGKVKLRLTGACSSCPMSSMTLKMGVERVIKKRIPEIKEVVSV
ncbi:MAG TPA: NifU family protein [Candidatus Omnitrophota bacterium]|mgnify:CR=1 FL=1|nr:NifU family protein [Candidatus Omnitrophota bacterium]